MDTIDLYRLRMKMEMIDLRKLEYGSPFCDLRCGRLGTQMHEIVSRRRMAGASVDDVLLSYAPPICSLLCDQCHGRVAPTKEGQNRLLLFNIELYGRDAVEDALNALPERFWRDIELPE